MAPVQMVAPAKESFFQDWWSYEWRRHQRLTKGVVIKRDKDTKEEELACPRRRAFTQTVFCNPQIAHFLKSNQQFQDCCLLIVVVHSAGVQWGPSLHMSSAPAKGLLYSLPWLQWAAAKRIKVVATSLRDEVILRKESSSTSQQRERSLWWSRLLSPCKRHASFHAEAPLVSAGYEQSFLLLLIQM